MLARRGQEWTERNPTTSSTGLSTVVSVIIAENSHLVQQQVSITRRRKGGW
jgi:hypothetical protein